MGDFKDPVYVVTRGDRRVEPNNYLDFSLAKDRSSKLIAMIQSFDKPCSKNIVKIVKTTSPHRIK